MGTTLVVTLMAVSDRLLLSVRLAHCLGPVARSCLSEVMSFWDLESSRKQIQGRTGGRTQLRQRHGALRWESLHHTPRSPQSPPRRGLQRGDDGTPSPPALGPREASPDTACQTRAPPSHARHRGAGFPKGDCVTTRCCGLRASPVGGVRGRAEGVVFRLCSLDHRP